MDWRFDLAAALGRDYQDSACDRFSPTVDRGGAVPSFGDERARKAARAPRRDMRHMRAAEELAAGYLIAVNYFPLKKINWPMPGISVKAR
ncbi:hypothetical protein [Paraburkholderia mimosarum]|uniref:hypothetical protein n=1 Tax=Paraburkholderia mimosarum TaxID=312026 RepID=UPI0012B59CF9|nr:hypothetical protein [Paraburkholderia mimosarum]